MVVRRYRCIECGHVWRQDTSRAAESRAKLSRADCRGALEGIVVQHLTVARIAEDLEAVAHALNNRPRKILDWKSPAEVFVEQLRLLQRADVASTS